MDIPLIEIVNIIDGEERLRSCMLSIRECDEDHPCPLHDLVGVAKNRFIKNLEETTISQLVEGIENGETVLPL